MYIKVVSDRRDLGRFSDFPYRLYKDDPIWVSPLRSEQKAQFKPEKNPMLSHCETRLFLLMEDGDII